MTALPTEGYWWMPRGHVKKVLPHPCVCVTYQCQCSRPWRTWRRAACCWRSTPWPVVHTPCGTHACPSRTQPLYSTCTYRHVTAVTTEHYVTHRPRTPRNYIFTATIFLLVLESSFLNYIDIFQLEECGLFVYLCLLVHTPSRTSSRPWPTFSEMLFFGLNVCLPVISISCKCINVFTVKVGMCQK